MAMAIDFQEERAAPKSMAMAITKFLHEILIMFFEGSLYSLAGILGTRVSPVFLKSFW
jgi:hypothetical protein